jgi:hypothetical protein
MDSTALENLMRADHRSPSLLDPLEAKKRPRPVDIVKDRLPLGVSLLELKGQCDRSEFGRLAHERLKIEPPSATAYRSMAAAALYADRPEITSRVSWEALRELSAPSLPWQVRQKTRSRHRRRQYTARHDENMPCGEVGDGPLKRVPTYRRESRAFVYISCR